MSRSRPTDTPPNPAQKWLEWNGEKGNLKYYDKEAETSISVPIPITFMLLDVLSTIKGWHDGSGSNIFSNEIRNTLEGQLIVKSFKGEDIAEGFYGDIREKIISAGGHFSSSLYIALKDEGKLIIANLQFKGAALRSWMEFQKQNRGAIYKQAITISGVEEGKKGKVTFKTPIFSLSELSAETDAEAKKLDDELQAYFDGYFKRIRTEEIAPPPQMPLPWINGRNLLLKMMTSPSSH